MQRAIEPSPQHPPSDAQVLGAVNRFSRPEDVVVCAAGGLPGELHKLWRAEKPGGYHVEYGYSCMGYEIAGGLGVKMAREDAEVYVLVGDGSYLMLNSEIVTSVATGHKLTVVVLDNQYRELGEQLDRRLWQIDEPGLEGDRLAVDAWAEELGLGDWYRWVRHDSTP